MYGVCACVCGGGSHVDLSEMCVSRCVMVFFIDKMSL